MRKNIKDYHGAAAFFLLTFSSPIGLEAVNIGRLLSKFWLLVVQTSIGVVLLFGCARQEALNQDQVCYQGKCVVVEVVHKKEDVMRGLQFRESLADNQGMLFIFNDAAPHAFWMKDTFIPLDMIWLDYSRRVVHMEANVPPCRRDPCPTYVPSQEAMYVLEINARKAAEWGIKPGEEFVFRLKDLK